MKCEFGFQLFCETAQDEAAIENARAYIKSQGLTEDDVRIRKKDGCIIVEAKRDICLKVKS